jgi:hypothetical protein
MTALEALIPEDLVNAAALAVNARILGHNRCIAGEHDYLRIGSCAARIVCGAERGPEAERPEFH